MKNKSYLATFKTESEAWQRMVQRNRAAKAAGNRDLVVMVDGPADDFCVVEPEDRNRTWSWL